MKSRFLERWGRRYLAQHRLFEQVPRLSSDAPLAADARFAEWTRAGPRFRADQQPIANLWFGPADVATPCHFDNHPNLLCQLVGRKLCYCWPNDAPIARGAPPDQNCAATDAEPRDPDAAKPLPLTTVLVLEPGDVLFIPQAHWHFVRSLTTSISASLWF